MSHRRRRSPECRERLFAQAGGMCVYGCGRPADHLDHIHPISRGGSNAIINMAAACTPCGQSKGDLTVMEWLLVLAAEIAAGCTSPVISAPE